MSNLVPEAIVADTDTTQKRILDAALQEFSQFGIAGARVERIAKAASTSKERLYAYFRSKEALYWTVAEAELARLAEATHLDASNLPEYAGRLFDYYEDRPQSFRILTWGQLEASAAGGSSVHWKSLVENKVTKVAEAQSVGSIDPTWNAAELLTLVSQTAASWALKPAQTERQRRRTVVVEAVRRLTEVTSVPRSGT